MHFLSLVLLSFTVSASVGTTASPLPSPPKASPEQSKKRINIAKDAASAAKERQQLRQVKTTSANAVAKGVRVKALVQERTKTKLMNKYAGMHAAHVAKGKTTAKTTP